MSTNIYMRRLDARIRELFNGQIDMSDFPKDTSKHFETRALAAFSLVMSSGLDVPKACIHITDGYHDMGIDAIYLDELQKQLFVVQSKWRSDGTGSIDQYEISNFVEGIKRILNLDLDGTNERISAKSMDIDTALTQIGYQIHAIFIHTGNQPANDYVLRPIRDLMNETNDDISTILVFSELNFKDIYTFLANGQKQDSIIIDDVILSNWGKVETPYISYYGMITASTIGEWYKKYGNNLFAKNIRYYKGDTEVNEGMKRVLLHEPDKFFYYNNGIKLLCKSIQRKAKGSTTSSTGLFALEGVSLVNGAQTTGTIGSAFLENPEQVAKALVMIQIIDLSNVDEKTAVQITKLSNTQNRIENKDFAALDPEQERLRTELTFAHYSYIFKSGDKITNFDKQISFDEAMVALACLNSDISYTVLAKGNVGALSEDITKVPYKALINPTTNSYSLLNSVLIMREVEKYLQKKRERVTGNRERLVCIHGNRFILYCILQEIRKATDFEQKIIDKANICNIIYPLIDDLVPKITDVVNDLYAESYPANIFKNLTKNKEIKGKVNGLVAI